MKSVSLSPEKIASCLTETLSEAVWGTIGPRSVQAAKKLATLLGREAALLCASGAGAAEAILRALEVSYGDEIVLPSYASPILKEAVEAVGAKPVFCEIDETLTMNPHALRLCISAHTQAIFCEEIAGYPAAVDTLSAIAKEHDLPLIDVCSSPYATRLDGKPTATYADLALCLLPVQNAAAIVTDSAFIAKLYGAHHCGNPYGTPGGLNTGICLGGDMRIDEFRSALIAELLERADERRRAKNSVKIRLIEALTDAGAEVLRPRRKADSAGDYILCRATTKEPCLDKASIPPYEAYTETARAIVSGVRFYSVF